MKNRTFMTLSVNINASETRKAMLNGLEYLVGPAVLAEVGAMNRVFYSQYELQNCLKTLNGRPLVLRHPYDDKGHPISANSPAVIDSQGIGYIFNSTFGADDKLRGELWLRMSEIETGRITGIDKDGTISANQGVLELSTGMYHNYWREEGEYKDKPYDIVAYDVVLDHVALLPDEIGAYSVEEGAGFPRWNVQDSNLSPESVFVQYARKHNGKVIEVSKNFFVYKHDGRLYKQTYESTSSGISINSDTSPVEVQQLVNYQEKNKGADMPDDKNKKTTVDPAVVEVKVDKKIEEFSDEEVTASFNARLATEDDVVRAITERLPWLADAKQLYENAKQAFVEKVAESGAFTAEEAGAMSFNALSKVAALAAKLPAEGEKDGKGGEGDKAPTFSLNSFGSFPVGSSDGAGEPLEE